MDTDVLTCTVECLMGSGEAVVIMVNPEERGNKERCVTIVPYRVQDGRKCHIVHGKLGWGIVHRCQPHGKCRAFVEYSLHVAEIRGIYGVKVLHMPPIDILFGTLKTECEHESP